MGRGMGEGDCGGMGMGMHKPFHHLEMLQYQLDLTNAQVDKLYKIDKDFMDKIYQNRNDKNKVKELMDKHHSDIESILNADQKEKWNEFMKNHPMRDKRMKDKNCPAFGPMEGMPGYHLDMLKKDLGLNDEQIDKIYKIHRDYMDKFYDNRNDGDKVRELRTKQDAEIENILTADQKVKWNEFKTHHPQKGKGPRDGKRGGRHHKMEMDDKE